MGFAPGLGDPGMRFAPLSASAWLIHHCLSVGFTGRSVHGVFRRPDVRLDVDQALAPQPQMKLILFVIIVIVALVIAARFMLRPGELRAQPRTMGGGGNHSPRVQQLRRSLMSKAMGDASKVDAWLEYERSKAPSLSEEECYVRANERWERDNR
jgi:hypothetical protein